MWIEDDEPTGVDDAETQTGAEPQEGQDTKGAPDGDAGKGADTKPEPTKSEKALDAFTKGVEAGTDPNLKPAAKGEDSDDAAGATGSTGADGATGATAAAGATGATAQAKTAEQLEQEKHDAALQAEFTEYGVKTQKAQKRWRELSSRPTWDEVNGKLEPLLAEAKEAQQYRAIITDTKANPQQLGEMFKVIGDINSGDPARIRASIESTYKQICWAAGQIGMPLEGFDPLANFPDLKEQVDAEQITRQAANEIMQARMSGRLTQTQKDQQRQTQEQQNARATALNSAINEIKAFDTQVRADPQYEAKKKAVAPTIERLKRTGVHPSKWAAEIKLAWNEIQIAPTPKPKPAPAPLRPGNGAGAARVPGLPKDPLAAFEMGIEHLQHGSQAYD